MEFSRQEYWSGLPFSSPRDLPNAGIGPGSPSLQADSLPMSYQGSPGNINILANVVRCLLLFLKSPFNNQQVLVAQKERKLKFGLNSEIMLHFSSFSYSKFHMVLQ